MNTESFSDEPVTIVVVGSINLDLNSFVASFPLPNQTISAKESNLSAGGKGFNQAVAASRAGAKVYFIGCVGDDISGQTAIELLNENKVDTRFIRTSNNVHTGTANIMVAEDGANMIAVAPGANSELTIDDVARAKDIIEQADVLLCQLECPLAVVEYALKLADSVGTKRVLNPAPVIEGAQSLIKHTDYVTPNELEADELTGVDPTIESQRKLASERLHDLGAKQAVVTLGSEGAFFSDELKETSMFKAFKVDAVNTTGAGDIFNGSFVCGIARGYTFTDAVVYASAASAISVTGKSAYDSAPTHRVILDFIENQGDISSHLNKAS